MWTRESLAVTLITAGRYRDLTHHLGFPSFPIHAALEPPVYVNRLRWILICLQNSMSDVAMPPGQALRWAMLSLGLATPSPACVLGSTPKGMSAGEMTAFCHPDPG